MRFDERLWATAAGPTRQWNQMLERRSRRALGELKDLTAAAEAGVADGARLLEAVLAAPRPVRDALARFPAFDYWLYRSRGFLRENDRGGQWSAHVESFASFSAAAAVLGRLARAEFPAKLSAEARFHITGTREFFEFPAECASQPALVTVENGRASVRLPSGREGERRELPEAAASLWVESRDPLVMGPVRVHPPAKQSPEEERRYAHVLAASLRRLRCLDPEFCGEMESFLRLLIPLENTLGRASVSSSYDVLRGALALSHSEDCLLQEETLIHEFSHQKLNLLADEEPLIAPGQAGQVFYSPLREDPRRLRGLLLGAHAFINVNRYLIRVLREEPLEKAARDSVTRNICRRLFHVEDMLRSVSGYASLTRFGKSFTLRLWREQMGHHHEALRFPEEIVAFARAAYREHRDRHAWGDTGFVKPALRVVDASPAAEEAGSSR